MRHYRFLACLGIVATTWALAQPPAVVPKAAAPESPLEPLRTPPDRLVDCTHIRLDLKVNLDKKTVDAVATLSLKAAQTVRSLTLDAVDFEVKKVTLINGSSTTDGESLKFGHDGKPPAIDLDAGWKAGATATLKIEYQVRDPKGGLYFFAPSSTEPDVPFMVWSQGESITNRYWIPCFDHPDQKQTSELVITCADGYDALSNGKLASRTVNPDKSVTYHWKQTQPHVSYLITMVVGKFDIVREEWNGKEVAYYVPAGKQEAIARTFGRTRQMLDFFSKRFGIEYPWDKYAQVVVEQFSAGGMENTSATTLTDSCLHDARAMLDSSPDGLIAHELGHQWWGDLLTCRDWSHLWLNEGFASYCEVLWDEHSQGVDAMHWDLLSKARSAIAGGKERPIVDRRYSSPDSMFDARAYPKGAWVLHMLRAKLGEETFWKGIRTYGTEHRYKTVETADLRRTMERVSGKNLERFFYDWTERPGNPALKVTSDYSAETKQLTLKVQQTQTAEAFHCTLPFSVYCEGSSLPVKFDADLDQKEHTFVLTLPGRPKMLLADPELTLLAEVTEEKGRDLLRTQLRFAPSIAPRIQAAKALAKNPTPADRELLANALASDGFYGVQAEVAEALGSMGGDASRDALLAGLKLPQPKARTACARELKKFVKDPQVIAGLKAKLLQGDPSYFVESACYGSYANLQAGDTVATLLPGLAKPSHNEVIRTAALSGLGESNDAAALDVLLAWTDKGKPRACRSSALGALAKLAKTTPLTDAQKQRLLARITDCLENEGRPVRRGAIAALRELGQLARPSVPYLEAIALHDPDGRIQDLAKKTAEAVKANTPLPAELTQLRTELDRLKKANGTLQERLDKLDAKEKK